MSLKKIFLDTLKEIIKRIEVKNRIPTDPELTDKEYEVFKKYLDNGFLTKDNIATVISEKVFEKSLEVLKATDQVEESRVIKDIKEFDTSRLVSDISEELESLPTTYDFVFKLYRTNNNIPTVNLTKDIIIKKLTSSEAKLYSPEEKTELDLRKSLISTLRDKISLQEGDIVLIVKRWGYVPLYDDYNLDKEDPIYIFKIILAIYFTLDILNATRRIVLFLNQVNHYSIGVFRDKRLHKIIRESSDDFQFISKLEFQQSSLELDEIGKRFKSNTDYENANLILNKILDPSNTSKAVLKIKNSSYWFYESRKSSEKHARIIYLTTAFDSLVGGDERWPAEIKAEIISHSVARSIGEREGIRSKIIDLYKIRNDIIHGNRPLYEIFKIKSKKDDSIYLIVFCSRILRRFLNKELYSFLS